MLADRGLYARWLCRRIVRLGWHPLLRITTGAPFRPDGHAGWVWLRDVRPPDGGPQQIAGTCCKERASQLSGPLLAWWDATDPDPCFVITDLAPGASASAWYRLWAWYAQGFKCTKRGGWQWQMTQMTDPDRAARLALGTGPTDPSRTAPAASPIGARTLAVYHSQPGPGTTTLKPTPKSTPHPRPRRCTLGTRKGGGW
ncbi:MAG: hypothetical protein AAGF95_24825 [Chloroflexota bacterium]